MWRTGSPPLPVDIDDPPPAAPPCSGTSFACAFRYTYIAYRVCGIGFQLFRDFGRSKFLNSQFSLFSSEYSEFRNFIHSGIPVAYNLSYMDNEISNKYVGWSKSLYV
jgi:hypothetical protein